MLLSGFDPPGVLGVPDWPLVPDWPPAVLDWPPAPLDAGDAGRERPGVADGPEPVAAGDPAGDPAVGAVVPLELLHCSAAPDRAFRFAAIPGRASPRLIAG